MKKLIYIFSFIVLGLFLQFLFHLLFERWYIGVLIYDLEKYGLGLSWDSWFIIHHIASILLVFLGGFFGFWQGKYWWDRLYDERGDLRKDIKFRFCKK